MLHMLCSSLMICDDVFLFIECALTSFVFIVTVKCVSTRSVTQGTGSSVYLTSCFLCLTFAGENLLSCKRLGVVRCDQLHSTYAL